MNNILFGAIGLLMIAILGIGYAEVKTQMHTSESEIVSPEKNSASSPSANEEPRTVSETLSNVGTRVKTAVFEEWESEDEHGEEDEDEDESVDDASPSASDSNQKATTNSNTSIGASSNTVAPNSGSATFTLTQVSAHSTATSCYSAIEGSVYDLTSFVSKHPGGQSAIKSLCGVDGTTAFNGQHGGERKAASVLAQYKIGVVSP